MVNSVSKCWIREDDASLSGGLSRAVGIRHRMCGRENIGGILALDVASWPVVAHGVVSSTHHARTHLGVATHVSCVFPDDLSKMSGVSWRLRRIRSPIASLWKVPLLTVIPHSTSNTSNIVCISTRSNVLAVACGPVRRRITVTVGERKLEIKKSRKRQPGV